MNLKECTNEELINVYKENNCAFKRIERVYGMTKNMAHRLFVKRGIDYLSIRQAMLDTQRQKREDKIGNCLYCGTKLNSFRKKFCNQSCAAKYNNPSRSKREYLDTCLNCGKELAKPGQKRVGQKYCSQKCQRDYLYNQWIDRWKIGEESGIIANSETSERIRRYMFEKHNNQCQNCGWHEQNPFTGKIPLQLHHIDGNCLNNKEDNLQLLCPNCHSLTENYGNLNKNSKRNRRK